MDYSIWGHRELVERIEELEAQLKPRTIVIECSGGLVQDVHGMRKGDVYDIADWDREENCESDENLTQDEVHEELTKKIDDAKAQ